MEAGFHPGLTDAIKMLSSCAVRCFYAKKLTNATAFQRLDKLSYP